MLKRIAALVFMLGPFATAAERPNILFLFADDMTWRAVHSLSGEDIETPNLDRLAARGATFTHAYNPGGWHGAICVASRTMLMTGKNLWKAREAERTLNRDFVPKQRLWPQLLSAAGYRTCFSGKWHVKADHTKVFSEIRHFRPGGMPAGHMEDGNPRAYFRPEEGKPDLWYPANRAEGGFWEGGKHWSEVVAEDFQAFLESDDKRPWFMYLAFNAPHDPRQSPQEFLDRYPLDRIPVPPNFLPLYPHREAMGADRGLRDEDLAPFPRTAFAVKTHRREYAALVTHLDVQIGRILDRLDASGAGENTYIFFTADHGLACGEHGLLGKQNLYDSSVRVPFFIAGPGVPAGLKVRAPIYLQDAMPTALALAGAPVPDDVDFRDLRPFWQGTGTPRPAVIGAYMDFQRMVEEDGKKLILYPRAKVARVFDLAADPHETRDLIATPEGRRIATRLFSRLTAIQKETGDPLDLTPTYPDLAAGSQ